MNKIPHVHCTNDIVHATYINEYFLVFAFALERLEEIFLRLSGKHSFRMENHMIILSSLSIPFAKANNILFYIVFELFELCWTFYIGKSLNIEHYTLWVSIEKCDLIPTYNLDFVERHGFKFIKQWLHVHTYFCFY